MAVSGDEYPVVFLEDSSKRIPWMGDPGMASIDS